MILKYLLVEECVSCYVFLNHSLDAAHFITRQLVESMGQGPYIRSMNWLYIELKGTSNRVYVPRPISFDSLSTG